MPFRWSLGRLGHACGPKPLAQESRWRQPAIPGARPDQRASRPAGVEDPQHAAADAERRRGHRRSHGVPGTSAVSGPATEVVVGPRRRIHPSWPASAGSPVRRPVRRDRRGPAGGPTRSEGSPPGAAESQVHMVVSVAGRAARFPRWRHSPSSPGSWRQGVGDRYLVRSYTAHGRQVGTGRAIQRHRAGESAWLHGASRIRAARTAAFCRAPAVDAGGTAGRGNVGRDRPGGVGIRRLVRGAAYRGGYRAMTPQQPQPPPRPKRLPHRARQPPSPVRRVRRIASRRTPAVRPTADQSARNRRRHPRTPAGRGWSR